MIISLKNHLSPDLRLEDKLEYIANFPGCGIPLNAYFTALSDRGGGGFCWHFWAYPLICTPVYIILKFLHLNPVMTFTITNMLLILLLFWWILFNNKAMSEKTRLFLAGITLFSPLWFYYPWTHPEVFTFVLLSIGLLESYNKRKSSAVFLTAVSSLQNPAAAVVPFFMMLYEIYLLIKDYSIKRLKEFALLTILSTTVFIPYIFYYYYFGKFSLIGEYSTDLHTISFAKIASLFTDLNFGLAIYVPVLCVLVLYRIFKRDKYAILAAITVFLFAVIDAAQLNWNPGIMLIHRYSYWMIPVLIFGCFDYFQKISLKSKFVILLLTIITITPWLFYSSTVSAKHSTKFQPLAQIALNTFPQLYNPQEEVFIERCTGNEFAMNKQPESCSYNNGRKILKTIFYDAENKKYLYINSAPASLSEIKIKIRHKNYIYYIGINGITKEKRRKK